ncbi:IucA/IucC family siderophore biosynthesis protein [Kitasatospora paracochleata]|uniref:Siderophore synthetase component n=1 Tax=Kitasatospora paracochleata TaxID=58354 RepID=A0ABT1ISC9_9ACTN|nr:IucA/IucC family siderophore biosynthesis protein [Kitasatospora paracochleata]MCP2307843.1 siderophore synthetase component [Kitasatospora paracochleata]
MLQQHPAEPELHLPAQLTTEHWRRARRALLAKMLGEFAYEELIEPVPAGDGWVVEFPDAGYRFRAERGAYGSWRVAEDSLDAELDDPLRFLQHARGPLGLSGDTVGHLVRELTATLIADAHLRATAPTAAELADLDHVALEGRQTGHPWIVPNKGRLGFSARDAAAWAPEARVPQRLPWIAVHRRLAEFRGDPGLYERELDADFRDRLGDRADDYLLLPVHPWQWDETVVPLFAPWIASGEIVPLPSDGDLRLPQQSIRSFFNLSRPDRCTVKLPLSILNTLVWRGLPVERTLAAPAVTAWIHGLRDADPFLRDECRVVLLGEIASVTVDHPVYRELPEAPYQYKELLGAIWREPLGRYLADGERARTLAALLQTGSDGRALVAELVARSGLAPRDWLGRLFAAMLPPLLHFLYRYGTVFSPHGENAIVLFDEHDVPTRLAVKDFVDDVNISDQPLPELADLPGPVAEVLLREDPDFLCQFIHSGLFIGVYRYLAPLVEAQLGVPEEEFWALVREEILAHQRRFPELAERFELFDLFTPRIARLCLNRNRLLLDGYRDRPQRPHAAVHGSVANPLHASTDPTRASTEPTRASAEPRHESAEPPRRSAVPPTRRRGTVTPAP